MQIRHLFPTTSSSSQVEGDRAFFLSNQLGDFLTLYTTTQTRYAGWFVKQPQGFCKILEGLEVYSLDGQPLHVVEITNAGANVFWEYNNGLKACWKLLPSVSGVSVIFSQTVRVRVILDVRGMYEYPSLGRSYSKQFPDPSTCKIRYNDDTLKKPLYVQVRSKESIQPIEQWQETLYPRDIARHSTPTSLYCYALGDTTTNSLSLGFGSDPDEADRACIAASKQRVLAPNLVSNTSHETLLTHMQTAKICVRQSLRLLQTEEGIYAGLPWFHQVWTRDELIAALGFTKDGQREVIERYLGHELQQGELPTYIGSHTSCADGVGWLCLLIQEYGLETLTNETRTRLQHFLERSYAGLQEHRQAGHGLIHSGHNATWMDTIGREGYRLEIQAMFALLLEQLYGLTQDERYHKEYLGFLNTVRHFYFKQGYLWDGLEDGSKRPNVFIAYLLQPNLLSQQSWFRCFDIVLGALNCPWGGLSSLDREHTDFHPVSSGEDNQSYHNGDSWFFVNNLAAIALHRFDQKRYSKQIVELLESSTTEVLWENMIGQPGEISSAARLESWGCGIQAFSGGTYLALLNELEDYSETQDLDASSFFWDSAAASA
jgi:hypothetical protein